MAYLNTLHDLLIHSIKDLHSAETQLVAALPKMAEAASDPTLKRGFFAHLAETRGHIIRIEQIAEILAVTPLGVSCEAMGGLVKKSSLTVDGEVEPIIKDLLLAAAARKIEHYEISG